MFVLYTMLNQMTHQNRDLEYDQFVKFRLGLLQRYNASLKADEEASQTQVPSTSNVVNQPITIEEILAEAHDVVDVLLNMKKMVINHQTTNIPPNLINSRINFVYLQTIKFIQTSQETHHFKIICLLILTRMLQRLNSYNSTLKTMMKNIKMNQAKH